MNRRPPEARHRSPSMATLGYSDASAAENDIQTSGKKPVDIRSRLQTSIRRQSDVQHRLDRSPLASPISGFPQMHDGSHRGSPITLVDGDSSRPPLPHVSFEDVREKLVQATMLAERANALSTEHQSHLRYQVSLQVPVTSLNQAKRENQPIACEPVIELRHAGVRLRSMSLARMQESVRELEKSYYGEQSIHQPASNESSTSSYVSTYTNSTRSSTVAQQKPSSTKLLSTSKTDVVLIGVANVSLRCLLFVSDFSYPAAIINPLGEVVGQIVVELSATVLPIDFPPSPKYLTKDEETSDSTTNQSDMHYLLSKRDEETDGIVELYVSIRQACGISSTFSKMIFCHYNLFFLDEPVVVLPRLESFTMDDSNQQVCAFNDTRSFRFPYSQEFISLLSNNSLSIEISGSLNETTTSAVRQSGVQRVASNLSRQRPEAGQMRRPVTLTKLRRYKSDVAHRGNPYTQAATNGGIKAGPGGAMQQEPNKPGTVVSHLTEEWIKLQRRIDLWVAIEELAEDGSYKKVAVNPSPDVKTGGVYELRQGLNRRIRVLIRPSELTRRERGTLPFSCETVTSVSVGCVSRSFVDIDSNSKPSRTERTAPDSYQEIDLELLRDRWCDAMDAWQSYLQENLQSLAKKKEKNAADEAREGYLLNLWVSSIQERDAVMFPAAGSSLPGAPASEYPPVGMEYHNPLLFAYLNDDQSPSNKLTKVGLYSMLDEEEKALQEGNSFVHLPFIKKYATLVGAVVSWDSNLHDDDLLNKITPPGERIYLIVKVHVLLSRPALVTLVLRKRICIKIEKRNVMVNFFRNPFSRMVSTEKEKILWTGVAYRFVAGIPQMSKSLLSDSSRSPVSSSTVENKADAQGSSSTESYAEQYARTIHAVSTEIYLDGLRQEVALQEAISSSQLRRNPSELKDLSKSMSQMALNGLARDAVYNTTLQRTRSFDKAIPQQQRAKRTLSQKRRGHHTMTYFAPTSALSASNNYESGRGADSDDSSVTIGPDSIRVPSKRQGSNLLSGTNSLMPERQVDGFQTSVDARLPRVVRGVRSSSEEKMAWTKRERDKQQMPKPQ